VTLASFNDSTISFNSQLYDFNGNPVIALEDLPNVLDLRVDIDSSTTPTAWQAPAGWTTISDGAAGLNGIQAWHMERGQREPFGPVEPGVCTITFKNRNGDLDPTNTASPFNALLTPGRQLRLVHRSNETGADIIVFHGNVTRWPVTFGREHRFLPTTEIEVVDLLGILGTSKVPASLVEYKGSIRQSGGTYNTEWPYPIHMWPLREEEANPNVRFSDSCGNSVDLEPIGSPPSAAGETLVPYTDIQGIRGTGLSIENGKAAYLSAPATTIPPEHVSVYFTLGAMVRCDEGGTAIAFWDTSSQPGLGLGIGSYVGQPGRRAHAFWKNGDGSTVVVSSANDYDDGRPHLLGLVHGPQNSQPGANKVLRLYVDGYLEGEAVTTGWFGIFNMVVGLGKDSAVALPTLWHVAVTTAQWSALNRDITRPWDGDRAPDRIVNLIGILEGAFWREFGPLGGNPPPGSDILLPVRLMGRTYLDIIDRIVEADSGRFWATRRGPIEFWPRSEPKPPVGRTYGIGGVPVYDMTLAEQDEGAVTHCVVENEAGSRQMYHDKAASKKIGERRLDIKDCPLALPASLRALCERVVNARKSIPPHVDSFTVRPADPRVSFDQCLVHELYDRIQVAYERAWQPGTVTETSEIIHMVASQEEYNDLTITYRVRPAP
jgi:hypothetical protein